MGLMLWAALAVGTIQAVAGELPPGVTRVAIMSDTHMTGPEYPLNTENGPIDNESISKTQQRLWRAVQALNAITPRPRLALFGGDVVHNGLDYLAQFGLNTSSISLLAKDNINGYKVARDIFEDLQIPQLFMWGNHDNLMSCGKPQESASKQLALMVYRRFFKAKAYDSRDVGPWKFVALNSMYGCTWDPTHPRCNDRLSSYGPEQLQWLHNQLSEGKPTLVMMHFPPTTSILNEVNTTEVWRDLRTVLTSHDNVKLVLSGHFHKGTDWEDLYPFPTLTLPAVRYSPQNFFVMDLASDGTYSIVDSTKNRGGARCSDWWTYADAPQLSGTTQGKDPGSCGYPAANQEAGFTLNPITKPSDVPGQDVFNPERSCQFVLAQKFLAACSAGASTNCCNVVADNFRASSSAPFSTCLCKPSFFQAATDFMQSNYQVDLSAVLGQCVSNYGKTLFYRGGPITWCPAPAA